MAFDRVMTASVGGYKAGDKITDDSAIAKLIENGLEQYSVQVEREAPPAPAPAPEARRNAPAAKSE